MPNVNQQFQGQTLILPGAYYSDNVTAGVPNSPPPTPPLIFIGYGYGGKPQTVQPFSDAQDLLNALRSGPCSGFVQFLTNPSPQFSGAQQISYINVGENTQSTLTLNNLSASGVALLTSANYGSPSNLLQCSISNGSSVGKKVQLFDAYANLNAVGDNLGVPFQLAYTGSASGVVYSVAASGLTATLLTIASPNSGESVSLQIGVGQYQTVAQIVNYLNGTGFYSAIVLGDGTLPASYLDVITNVGLPKPVVGVDQYVNVTAALGAVVYWVNQYASSFAAMTVSGFIAQLTSTQGPANIPFTSFSGAVSIPPTNNDYANALNLALTTPGWAVFIDSNSSAVQALGAQHVITASQPSVGKYRRFFTGSSIGDSVTTTITNAQALDALQCSYVYPGLYRTNPNTGQNVLYGGLYGAAAAAGMATGNQVALPLTNKALTSNGVEVQLTVSQINQLQQAGVMCLSAPPSTGLATIVSDLTSWQVDNNPENVFNQQVACRFYLAYSFINALSPYVGTIASSTTLTQVQNAIKQALNQLIYTPGNNGVLNSWDASSLVLTYSGQTQTLNVQVSVQLVGQNRFITIFVPIQPLNLTLNSQTATLQSVV